MLTCSACAKLLLLTANPRKGCCAGSKPAPLTITSRRSLRLVPAGRFQYTVKLRVVGCEIVITGNAVPPLLRATGSATPLLSCRVSVSWCADGQYSSGSGPLTLVSRVVKQVPTA